MRWRLVAIALVALYTREATANEHEADHDTNRLTIGLSATVFSNYPGSYSDLGVSSLVAKPLWLGQRNLHSQLELRGALSLGWGVETSHFYAGVAPQVGLSIFLGNTFGLEFHVGPALMAQVGERSVIGAGVFASGGYVFRPWDDDRRRIMLAITTQVGFYFASDPENDLAANAGALALGVAYETPL